MIRPAQLIASEIIGWIDAPITPQGAGTEKPPCGNTSAKGGPRSILLAYNVILESPKHLAAFERVRAGMTARGFKITSYDAGSDGWSETGTSGKMSAKDPQTGYGMRLSSTSPAKEITIWISTPCFVPAPTTAPSAPSAAAVPSS
ncbi:hypothetical protein GT354_14780 [Streptomyces sp. SID3343]|nr:hypothetical protein [Streptomyces sp. SID3343]